MSPFTSVPLSPDEELSGSILTQLQKSVLQNRRAEIATQKLNLVFTPNDVLSFTQNEAFLKGQLELIQWIFDVSEESEKLVASTSN